MKDLKMQNKFKFEQLNYTEFVGELYCRGILPEKNLLSMLESLLYIGLMKNQVDEIVIRGAITLMNKVGQTFEQSIKTSSDTKKDEMQKFYDKMVNRCF